MRDSYTKESPVRHTKCGRMRGMVVGEGSRSTGVLLYREVCGRVAASNIIILVFGIKVWSRYIAPLVNTVR